MKVDERAYDGRVRYSGIIYIDPIVREKEKRMFRSNPRFFCQSCKRGYTDGILRSGYKYYDRTTLRTFYKWKSRCLNKYCKDFGIEKIIIDLLPKEHWEED